MNERNQRRAERDNHRLIEGPEEKDARSVEVVSGHVAVWGGAVGIAAAVVATIAGVLRVRRRQ
jgi:hypothetical protein